MRVIHIVPSAFNYFDDIREAAFGIIKNLEAAGVECEVITLQYSAPSRAVKEEVGKASGGAKHFDKTEEIADVISSFGEYDAVHLHCPFLGAAGKILAWARPHHNTPLIVSYYRDVRLLDLFSLFISFYNSYYLSRIFKLADALTCIDLSTLPSKWQKGGWGSRFLGLLDKRELIPLTASGNKVKLTVPECEKIASRILFIYDKITC